MPRVVVGFGLDAVGEFRGGHGGSLVFRKDSTLPWGGCREKQDITRFRGPIWLNFLHCDDGIKCELLSMSKVREIGEAIEKLPREELLQLSEWMAERCSDAWDQQIEEDVFEGRLDELAAEALAEHRAGGLIPFPPHEEQGE